MEKNKKLKQYFTYGIIAAVLYCISVAVYIRSLSFTGIWILFVGNVVFAAVIAAYIFNYNIRRNSDTSSIQMVKQGHIISIIGIVISALLVFLLLVFLVPDVFKSTKDGDATLMSSPTQLYGKNNGLLFVLVIDLIFGNIATSSFVSFMLPFSITKAQKGEREPTRQL